MTYSCPNCGTAVSERALECGKCSAQFTDASGWRPVAEKSVAAVGASATEYRASASVVAVALVVWLPALFVYAISRGRLFDGIELLGALGPALALVVPAVVAGGRRGSALLNWALAIAPLLLVAGSFFSSMAARALHGHVPFSYLGASSNLLAAAVWAVPGWLVYRALRVPARRSSSHDA